MWPQGLAEGMRLPEGKNKNLEETNNVSSIHEAAAGSRCPLRSPDPPLEPQDGRVHLHCERNGIYIIDLQKTVKKLEEAYDFRPSSLPRTAADHSLRRHQEAGDQDAVKEEAARVGMYYVNARWLGGMLTNFKTMRTRVDRLAQLKKMQEDGTFDMLPKKEVMKHHRRDREA